MLWFGIYVIFSMELGILSLHKLETSDTEPEDK